MDNVILSHVNKSLSFHIEKNLDIPGANVIFNRHTDEVQIGRNIKHGGPIVLLASTTKYYEILSV